MCENTSAFFFCQQQWLCSPQPLQRIKIARIRMIQVKVSQSHKFLRQLHIVFAPPKCKITTFYEEKKIVLLNPKCLHNCAK